MVVLIENKTKEARVYNVGDRGVAIEQVLPATTKSGKVGTRRVVRRVSTSLRLEPGERKRADGIILKQAQIKHDQKMGYIKVTVVNAAGSIAMPKMKMAAPKAIPQPDGSHPVEELGTADVKEVLRSKRGRASRR